LVRLKFDVSLKKFLLKQLKDVDNNNLKPGDSVKVFDYGNEIYDELVKITSNDTINDIIIYERLDGELIHFSGQGYFQC
jgi:hypothetical protein